MQIGETITPSRPSDFRAWLRHNHRTKTEIWLVQFKKSTGKITIDYAAAVEEAICFGWIDSSIKTIDDERYATRFTPRRPGSSWTATNKALARRLAAEGRMTEAGRKALPKGFRLAR